MTSPFRLYLFLALLGIGWGLTQTLSKIAVSTGHLPLGLIFWQLVIGVLVLGPLALVRRSPLPRTRAALVFCIVLALIGSILPNVVSYTAYRHLPAGIMSIVISAVPILSFPVALALGLDRFGWGRLLGLVCGLVGVALIALPDGGLPGGTSAAWLLFALLGPLFYAFEGNYVARNGTAGLDPIGAMFGASLVGAIIVFPFMLAGGQYIDPLRPWGTPEYALLLSSAIHALMYAGYVWLVSAAGPVFAGQTSYLVTGAGVVWAMAILGERYSPWVWLALAVMMAGIFLVQPRSGGGRHPAPGPA